jgi:hypothetical protein
MDLDDTFSKVNRPLVYSTQKLIYLEMQFKS